MKNKKTIDAGKAQNMVLCTMDDITRASKKVLIEYLYQGYLKTMAKALAYLEIDDSQVDDILQSFEPDVRKKIMKLAQSYKKDDDQVISEVEHIIDTEGMSFENDYQIIKENLPMTGQDFAKQAVENFRRETPILQEKLNRCIFDFEDILLLNVRAIQKVLRDTDQQELAKALKGASPELQAQIFGCMSPRAADMLKEDMEFMGPVRLSDVEAARTRIVQTVFRLEEEGDIQIANVTIGELLVD